jgi:hypothetical protein
VEELPVPGPVAGLDGQARSPDQRGRHAAAAPAFIGVRSCELHAIAVQDRVFLEGGYVDRDYQRRRDGAFIVAVNGGQAAATCFCVSMDTGPRARCGFDLALSEVLEDGRHCFVVEVGSERGADVLTEVAHREATPDDRRLAELRSRTPLPARRGPWTRRPSRSCSTATASIRAGMEWPTAA